MLSLSYIVLNVDARRVGSASVGAYKETSRQIIAVLCFHTFVLEIGYSALRCVKRLSWFALFDILGSLLKVANLDGVALRAVMGDELTRLGLGLVRINSTL